MDELLKKEFDRHRKAQTKHKICEQFGVDAIPLNHEKLDIWRHNFAGLETLHKPTNLLIFGAVDDIWVNPAGEWIVVDYKATSKRAEITLDTKWGKGYKRQLEIYQWILKQNGEPVSETAYILYCNNILDREDFDNRLDFEVSMFKHEGDTSWVEPKIIEAHKALVSGQIPSPAEDCEYCAYREAARLKEVDVTKEINQ
ncbi:MAG: PD-(D/E)XK nuclease family protein [Patescibacteria group bacterium]